ncbi:hypothetical protein QIH30_27775, partial [Klebsiella pneumoniae]|nr:hypothetical protein [Klebsiella pneumoniae]
RLPLPPELYLPRINSKGIEFGERAALDALLTSVDDAVRPSNSVKEASEDDAAIAVALARTGFAFWSRTTADTRAIALER